MAKIEYNKILNFLNKWFYSFYFPTVLLLLFFCIDKTIIKNWRLSFILYFIVILFWLIKLTYVPKNKSKKYGIIFLVDNNTYYNDNRNLFFKKLSFSLEEYFKICVINRNCLKKYDTEEAKNKIMNKKNYQMIINTFAMDTTDNNDFVCSLNNKSIIFSTPTKHLDENTMKTLQNDFNNGFHKIIKLRKKEMYNDINENTDLMANSIRYLVSIIFIIFGRLNDAENLLNKLNFSNLPSSNKIVQYLKKGIVYRYIDIHFIYSIMIVKNQKYLYDKLELMELEKHIATLEKMIQKQTINNNYLLDLYDMKAKMLFAQKKYYDSLGLLQKINRKKPHDYIILLSLGFMYINMNNIPEGVKKYKKAFGTNNIDSNKIDECISFINNCLKSRKYNATNLQICLGIIHFYWKNKEEGKAILKSVIENIKSEDDKDYIKVRYIR